MTRECGAGRAPGDPRLFFSRINFWAVKVKLLRSKSNPVPWCEPMAAKTSAGRLRQRQAGRAPGNFAWFLPENNFGGSENAVTPVERLRFDGAGRWFEANPPAHAGGSSVKNLCSAFSSDSFSRAVRTRFLRQHASALVQIQKPAFVFLPRLNFAGSEFAVTSNRMVGGSIPPALRRIAQW